jgi:hypothetical protein
MGMKKGMTVLVILLFLTMFFACGDDDGATTSGTNASNLSTVNTQTTQNDQSAETAQDSAPTPAATMVTLRAFSDFSCTSNWTNRDGAMGLSAGSGQGTCQATFPGVSGNYRITVRIQAEFDGRSPFQILRNGAVLYAGRMPLSSPLGCDCPLDQWRSVCPDRVIDLDAGVHALNNGDVIGFYGEETYPCGEHGAYAKWHLLIFTPA